MEAMSTGFCVLFLDFSEASGGHVFQKLLFQFAPGIGHVFCPMFSRGHHAREHGKKRNPGKWGCRYIPSYTVKRPLYTGKRPIFTVDTFLRADDLRQISGGKSRSEPGAEQPSRLLPFVALWLHFSHKKACELWQTIKEG